MHYADGTPANLGDLVLYHEESETWGAEVIGVLIGGTPSSAACNGILTAGIRRQKTGLGWGQWTAISFPEFSVTVGKCVKVAWPNLAVTKEAAPSAA